MRIFRKKRLLFARKRLLRADMLIEFKVANYRSIRAEQTLSMVANADKELPQNLISCDHVPGLKGTKLVKAVALYGANASGKSNIVAALRFFAEFVRDSATKLQPGAPTGAQPFKLDPACLTEPSKFEITAVINGIRTLYGIEMTRERVTSEYIVAYPNGRPQVWFERDWDEKKGKYTWSKSAAHFKHDAALREKTRENAAFLSVAAQWNVKNAETVQNWVKQKVRFLDIEKALLFRGAARELISNERSHSALAAMLARADLGVAGMRTKTPDVLQMAKDIVRFGEAMGEETLPIDEVAEVFRSPDAHPELKQKLGDLRTKFVVPELLHHSFGGELVPLDFYAEESSGTRRYFDLMAEVFLAAAAKRFAVADELENSLHPHLFHELIRTIFTVSVEESGAQFLFTTHNPLLLDQTLLRRDQIWFTEKDQEGATRLYPLTDFKPRKDESLVKGYLAGRYGGIPFIPEGLKF